MELTTGAIFCSLVWLACLPTNYEHREGRGGGCFVNSPCTLVAQSAQHLGLRHTWVRYSYTFCRGSPRWAPNLCLDSGRWGGVGWCFNQLYVQGLDGIFVHIFKIVILRIHILRHTNDKDRVVSVVGTQPPQLGWTRRVWSSLPTEAPPPCPWGDLDGVPHAHVLSWERLHQPPPKHSHLLSTILSYAKLSTTHLFYKIFPPTHEWQTGFHRNPNSLQRNRRTLSSRNIYTYSLIFSWATLTFFLILNYWFGYKSQMYRK